MAKRERIGTYNAWRGIAAVMIVFSHMSYLADAVNPFWSYLWYHFMHNGGICSSFFFLLSGFFLNYTWKNQRFGVYLKEKLKRIYPLTLIVFLLALAIDILLPNNIVTEGIAVGSAQWFFNIAANIFLFKAFIPLRSTFYSFHGPSWYISVLFVFYVVAYWFVKGIKSTDLKIRKKWLKILFGGVLAAYVTELILCIIVRMHGSSSLYPCYVNPYFRIFGEGVAGILLCEYEEKIQEKVCCVLQKLRMSYTMLEAGAVILFLFSFILRDIFRWNVWQAWLQIIPMGSVLIAFRRGNGAVSKWLGSRLWIFLGTISFELYMTHAFVYEGIPIAVGVISKGLQNWIVYHAGTRFVSTFFTCIVFAWFVNIAMCKLNKKTNKIV